jgi:hypothetical protein
VLEMGAGNCWRDAGASLPAGAEIQCVAIGGAAPDTTYYVGFTRGNTSSIWASKDGGTNWVTNPSGLPTDMTPTRIVIDANDPSHAYAGYGGQSGGDVYVTNNSGVDWHRLVPTSTLIPQASIQALAMSPDDPNEIYAAIEVGVLQGTVTPGTPPHVGWMPFDRGLPNGVDVTSLAVNAVTHVLIAGTLGYGAYECSIGNGTCPQDRVLVRDNVFDRGAEPSPQHFANPEDPIQDLVRSRSDITFFKHNDLDPGGLLDWWSSEDVRISVPNYGTETDAWIVDPVTVESCPISATFCPPGTIPDEAPVRGRNAHVYVQIHNTGTRVAHRIRVLAIWADASVTVPPLPNGFWTQTFPAQATACGAWPSGSAWHFFDDSECTSSFSIVPELAPDASRIVTFEWSVPGAAKDHCCLLLFAESDEDPLPDGVRNTNVLDCTVLVPNHHQIAQRNLQLIGPQFLAASRLTTFKLANGTGHPWKPRLVVARGSLPKGTLLDILLPSHVDTLGTSHFSPMTPSLSAGDLAKAQDGLLNVHRAYRLKAPQGEIRTVAIPPGATWNFGAMLRLPSGAVLPGRFIVSAVRDSNVMGGNTYVITARP